MPFEVHCYVLLLLPSKVCGFFSCSLDHYLVKVYLLNVVTVARNAVCCLSFVWCETVIDLPRGFGFCKGHYM